MRLSLSMSNGQRTRWGLTLTGLLVGLVSGLIAGLSPAQAAVPNRNLSFVALPADPSPWAVETAARVARHAQERLGLNPRKVHVADRPPTVEGFSRLFRAGRPFQYVSQSDLVVVYVVGAKTRPDGVALADGVLPWSVLASVGDLLRQGPGDDLGFFDGTVLVVLDGVANRPPDQFSNQPGTAVLTLLAKDRAPWSLATRPGVAVEAIVRAGAGALAQANEPPPDRGQQVQATPNPAKGPTKGQVSRGALAWAGALEQMLENPERLGADAEALVKHLKTSRSATGVKAALLKGRDFEPRRFRLLLPRLRVVLHPRLLRNVETVGLLDRLKAEIEAAAPEALAPLIQVARTEVADPTADIDCQAVASAKLAYLECVEGRTPLFADRIDISEPATALAPVVQQILRDYRRLVARDWSARSGAVRPVDVVLLLDQSLSMAWHDPTHMVDPGLPLDGPAKREVTLVRIAATLGAHAMSTGLRARLSVLLFGEQVTPLPLGPGGEEWLRLDKRLSGDTLAGLAQRFRSQARPARYTGIASALDAAAARVAGGSPEAARHVILVTDGVESVVTEGPREAVRAAASRVKAAGATLHTLGLSEQSGRLPAFLQALRQGGPLVQRYAGLREMAFAPAACRRPASGSDIARRCGDFYARMIESSGGYDPALLDEIRRSDRAGVPTGLCLLTDERAAFQRTLPELLSALTGEGVYATRHGVRQSNPLDPSIVLDTWRFDLDLRTSAKVLIYNRDALDFTEWAVLQDGRKLTLDDGLEVVSESDAVTVVTLPAPARGVWIVQRQGRLAALGAAQEGARP